MNTTLQDPLVGRTLDGRYRVEARIAVGGMATVYRAVDTRLDRVLALKVMHPGLAADGAFVERFIHEAKSVARLAHPNVVGVYDQGTDGGYVYLAMEHVAGCTLRDVLRERGALQPRAALDILEPVLAALGAAHRAGLAHRDMKPENVLIGDDGRVKVADFGLVRAVGTQTSVSGGSLLGTVSYLAPEQIEHGTAGTPADVYGCGVMLYEMLTGAKPHSGKSAAQVLYQHLHESVAAPSALVPGLAPELDDLVLLATARDPAVRPTDAVALLGRARATRALLTGEQLDAVPPRAHPGGGRPAGPEDRTSVLPRLPADAAGPEDRTSVLPRLPGEQERPLGPRAGADRPPLPEEEPSALAQEPLAGDALNRTSRLDVPPGGPQPARAHRGGPRRGRWGPVTLLLLVLGVGTGVWYVNSGQFTTVPPVLNLSQEAAERKLGEAGLDVGVRRDFHETVDRGRVVSSDPRPGGRIRNTGTVTLTVSRGPEVVAVPDVAGKSLERAREELRKAGLSPGTVGEEFSEKVPQGAVVRTDPKAGTERSPDSAVALVVSRGEPVDVPDMVGASLAEARDELRDAGLEVEVARERIFSEEERDAVARQSPGGGDRVAEGDTVTLTLSKGPELVEVPDVERLDVDEATRRLESAGFAVQIRRFFFGDRVFDQSVEAGEEAPKGSTVTLRVR